MKHPQDPNYEETHLCPECDKEIPVDNSYCSEKCAINSNL